MCETHLQNTVLWEVCAVHCVPHFVFPIKAAQRVGTEVPRDFLLHENSLIVISFLMNTRTHRPIVIRLRLSAAAAASGDTRAGVPTSNSCVDDTAEVGN